MTAIIDYDAGNIKSVEKALQHLGEEVVVTDDAAVILRADHVILPGVGAFGDAMENLKKRGLILVIHRCVEQETPFLGICLGLQLLFEDSEESPGINGLGILKGHIRRLPEGEGRKIPHIGWNSLALSGNGRLFAGIQGEPFVYFVHSYYLEAAQEAIVRATAEYGVSIHASVEEKNVFACQFHPEKSSETGLMMLQNFLSVKGVE